MKRFPAALEGCFISYCLAFKMVKKTLINLGSLDEKI